jgi:hypothetical protein
MLSSKVTAPKRAQGFVPMSSGARRRSSAYASCARPATSTHDRFSIAREVWWYPYKDVTHRGLLRAGRLLFGKRFWQQ